jgi:hypothetical protein
VALTKAREIEALPEDERRLVLAGRLLADLIFGEAPFYELELGGPFEPTYLLGGSRGVRGVPWGRSSTGLLRRRTFLSRKPSVML